MDPYRTRRYSTSKPGDGIDLRTAVRVPQPPDSVPHLAGPTTVRYAEWRPGPPSVGTPWRQALSEAPRGVAVLYPIICVSVFVAGFAVGFANVFAWIFALMAAWMLLLLHLKRGIRLERERMEQLESMRDDGAAAQFLTKARFFAGRQIFDSDHGLVSVVGGSLYFVGERTSFSFSPRAARMSHGVPGQSRFEFLRYGQKFAVEFVTRAEQANRPQLADELHRFANGRVEPSSVEVLPATRPSPEALARSQIQALRAVVGLGAALLLPDVYMLGSCLESGSWAAHVALETLLGTVLAFSVLGLSIWTTGERRGRMLRALIDEATTYGIKRT